MESKPSETHAQVRKLIIKGKLKRKLESCQH